MIVYKTRDEIELIKESSLLVSKTLGEINKISDRNIIIFCLPTPLKQKNLPDLSYFKNALS